MALIERVTRSKGLPEEVLNQILARTDGVPLEVRPLAARRGRYRDRCQWIF